MSKYIVQWKTSYLGKYNPFLFLSCTFKFTLFVFFRRFGRILYFCSNNGPLPNVIFSTLYLKNSLFDWRLKSKEMTECLKVVDFTDHFSSITRARLKNQNCVNNVTVQALSASVKFSRLLMQKILTTSIKIRATEQNLNDRNKIPN